MLQDVCFQQRRPPTVLSLCTPTSLAVRSRNVPLRAASPAPWCRKTKNIGLVGLGKWLFPSASRRQRLVSRLTTDVKNDDTPKKLDRASSWVERRVPLQATSSTCVTPDGVLRSTAEGEIQLNRQDDNVKWGRPSVSQSKGDVQVMSHLTDEVAAGVGTGGAAAEVRSAEAAMKEKSQRNTLAARSRGLGEQSPLPTSCTVTQVPFASRPPLSNLVKLFMTMTRLTYIPPPPLLFNRKSLACICPT